MMGRKEKQRNNYSYNTIQRFHYIMIVWRGTVLDIKINFCSEIFKIKGEKGNSVNLMTRIQ